MKKKIQFSERGVTFPLCLVRFRFKDGWVLEEDREEEGLEEEIFEDKMGIN